MGTRRMRMTRSTRLTPTAEGFSAGGRCHGMTRFHLQRSKTDKQLPTLARLSARRPVLKKRLKRLLPQKRQRRQQKERRKGLQRSSCQEREVRKREGLQGEGSEKEREGCQGSREKSQGRSRGS